MKNADDEYQDDNLEGMDIDNVIYFDEYVTYENIYRFPHIIEKERDKHPPFYPFNTFALRYNLCGTCNTKVIGAGWYFRFINVQGAHIFCKECFEISWKMFLNNTKYGILGMELNGVLSEKIGDDLIRMLQGAALTN